MRPGRPACCAVLLFVVGASAADKIQLVHPGPGSRGALIDGTLDGSFVNDRRVVSPASGAFFASIYPAILPGAVGPSAVRQEIIAYSVGHPPTIVESVPWTGGDDVIRVTFEDEARIDLAIWLVGTDGDPRAQATENAATMAGLWRRERTGLAIGSLRIEDVRGLPAAREISFFDCSKAERAKTELGFDPTVLNVYFVDSVEFGEGLSHYNGVWCYPASIVAVGSLTDGLLLAHELGHAFGLGHTDDLTAYFDDTDVMRHASDRRSYFTEGQTMRMFYLPWSVLRYVYGLVPSVAPRPCAETTDDTDPACPPIQKRVWADGAFGPN